MEDCFKTFLLYKNGRLLHLRQSWKQISFKVVQPDAWFESFLTW